MPNRRPVQKAIATFAGCALMTFALLFGASFAQASGKLVPLTPKMKKLFWSSAEDKPVTRPAHHFKTNEKTHELFRPFIKNMGGGYVGVASAQNYTLIAWARSKFAWLIDFDDVIQHIHRIHRAFMLVAPTAKQFMQLWHKKNKKQALTIIRKTYKGWERRGALRWYRRYQRQMYRYLSAKLRKRQKANPNWLNTPSSYSYIRRMFQLNRIRIMHGNLFGKKTLRGIGTAAKKAKLPIRVVYFSNAEEWFLYFPSFRKNIYNLPFDKKSVVLRTLWAKQFQPRSGDTWHYNVQKAIHFQKYLKEKNGGYVVNLEPYSLGSRYWGVSLIGFGYR